MTWPVWIAYRPLMMHAGADTVRYVLVTDDGLQLLGAAPHGPVDPETRP
jgi:hypothetical protein